jgi:hypothetical protein
MHGVLNIVINVVVLFAWGFFVWGFLKYKEAHKPERLKDRNFQVKVFWVLFFGSILWLAVGLTDFFSGAPFLTPGFLTFALGYSAHTINKTAKALKRK